MKDKLLGFLCRFPAVYLICQGLAAIGFGMLAQILLTMVVLYCYESSLIEDINNKLEDKEDEDEEDLK